MIGFFRIFEKKTMKPNCSKCTTVKDLPKCLDQIVIGTIADINTPVDIYLQTSTERLTKFTTTSDGAGVVKLDTTDFEPNQVLKYDLWVTLENAGIYNALDLTIEGTIEPIKCVSFNFKTTYNGNGAVVSFASETLKYCA